MASCASRMPPATFDEVPSGMIRSTSNDTHFAASPNTSSPSSNVMVPSMDSSPSS